MKEKSEVYIIFFRFYKWGRKDGYLRWEHYVLFKATSKENAKTMAKLVWELNSPAFPLDIDPVPDLRTIRRVKNQAHLEKLGEELGFYWDDLTVVSEKQFEWYDFNRKEDYFSKLIGLIVEETSERGKILSGKS